jgi:hypothetical protein
MQATNQSLSDRQGNEMFLMDDYSRLSMHQFLKYEKAFLRKHDRRLKNQKAIGR